MARNTVDKPCTPLPQWLSSVSARLGQTPLESLQSRDISAPFHLDDLCDSLPTVHQGSVENYISL